MYIINVTNINKYFSKFTFVITILFQDMYNLLLLLLYRSLDLTLMFF